MKNYQSMLKRIATRQTMEKLLMIRATATEKKTFKYHADSEISKTLKKVSTELPFISLLRSLRFY